MRAAVFAWAVVALAGLAWGCTEADVLSSVAPFPCAKDGTCPVGYQCKAGAAGVAATCISIDALGGGSGIPTEKALDQICSGNDICTDGTCAYGLCSPNAATSDTKCPLSHPVNGEFACLLPCNTASDCPTGLACTDVPIGYGGALMKGCVSSAFAAFQDQGCNGNTPGECGPTSTPYTCIGGACELSCSTGSSGPGCPSDRVCQPPHNGATTTTACFYNCEGGRDGGPSGGDCPQGGATQCTTFTGDPGSYCSP